MRALQSRIATERRVVKLQRDIIEWLDHAEIDAREHGHDSAEVWVGDLGAIRELCQRSIGGAA